MAAFVQLTRPNGARFSVNVDHIIEFWEPGESWAQDMNVDGWEIAFVPNDPLWYDDDAGTRASGKTT